MTTRPAMIPFGDWTPDLPEYDNPGALIARNVIPQLKSYRSLNSLTAFSNALAAAALGAFWVQDAGGVVFNFAGDIDALYRLTGGATWTDISGPSAPYGVDNWEFTKFGDRVIAAGFQANTQYFDLATSPAFADLAGSPPRARRIATIRDFVVYGDTDIAGGGGGTNVGPNFVQWSGFNNSELNTPDLATQSDFQELFGRGGRVQRIVPGEYGVVFQEHSIYRMDLTNPPIVFQFDEVERRRGTPAPGSVLWTGETVFYYGWDGFYVFDGRKSTPISANRVSRWFRENSDAAALDSMRGAIDRQNRLVIWAFKSVASATQNDRLIIYNWAADKWAYAELDTQIIDEFVSPGFTLDELDTVIPGGIDAASIPVDSDQFKGGALNIQAFDSSNQSSTFSGTPLTATIDTKEISGPDNDRMYVNSIRPLVEGSGGQPVATVEVGTRDSLGGNVAFTAPTALNAINGEANVRADSRYQRYRVNIDGGFTHADGVRAHIRSKTGRR